MAAKKSNPKRHASNCVECGKPIRVAARYNPKIYHPDNFDASGFDPWELEGLDEFDAIWLESLTGPGLEEGDYTIHDYFRDIFSCRRCYRKNHAQPALRCEQCGRFFRQEYDEFGSEVYYNLCPDCE